MKLGKVSIRALVASAAVAAAVALGGCNTDGVNLSERAMRPLSPEMVSLLASKNMPKESPMLVRLYKEEAELEVWKQDGDGRFQLLKTYPICRWSGELGPKVKEGDRQAPEGFYTITPAQMNPNSNYFLAFNIGYPNAYDRANDRTGSFLMIHGDCSSRGCYAMTDEQISEIYALGREAFFGGQKSFQVQAYPFHMTAENMAKHRNSPHMAFWRMIKQGSDYFEATRIEPKVDVCERHYVFGAEGNATHFDPRGKCPPVQMSPEIASVVKDKQAKDEQTFASLVAKNVPTAPIRTGTDGGTHPSLVATWMSKARELGKEPVVSSDGEGHVVAGYALASAESKPATPAPTRTAAAEPKPAAPPPTRVASATPASDASGGSFFGNLFHLSAKADTPAETTASAVEKPVPVPKPAPKPTTAKLQVAQKPAETKSIDATAQRPSEQPTAQPTPQPSVMAGSQPTVPTGTFNNRWDQFK